MGGRRGAKHSVYGIRPYLDHVRSLFGHLRRLFVLFFYILAICDLSR